MEEIIIGIVSVIVVVLSYIFGRSRGHDGGEALDRVDDAIRRTDSKLSDAREDTEGIIKQSESIGERLDSLSEGVESGQQRVGAIKEGLASASERLDGDNERNDRIKDLVSELQKRSVSKNDKDDNN